ncbi:MAG: glycosyltransferase [Anaerolineae bacterium]|nr:glycosyltransferase [Anaerolineae bacterium]
MNTFHILLSALLAISFLPAALLLSAYGLNLVYLLVITFFKRHNSTLETPLTEFPHVTVQLPLYNERYVSRRLIDAVAQLDYPLEKLVIQVLDDSTDDTSQIVAEAAAYWRKQGRDVQHLRRADRKGYKAGALAYGLQFTQSEYIAIFDADFVPPPDFLKKSLPALIADPKAAFIQTRWEHLNAEQWWLTRMQAIAVDSHFSIEQQGRAQSGMPFNFNGTAGIWRRAAIQAAGGWLARTLTEDLDLSYRAWLSGWRALYRCDISAPAELPPTMSAYKRQQARWAQGSLTCARLLLPQLWCSALPLSSKLEGTVHLLSYLVSPLMMLIVVAYALAVLFLPHKVWQTLPFMQYAVTISPFTFMPLIYLAASQLLLKRSWRALPYIIILQVVSSGLAVTIARAALKGLLGQHGEFLRTPKWGNTVLVASAYQLYADSSVLLDIAWGAFCLLTALIAARHSHYFFVLYGVISCVGSWTVAFYSLLPSWQTAPKGQHAT